MADRTFRQKIKRACAMIPLSLVFFGVSVWAYEAYSWLWSGHWNSTPASVLLNEVLPDGFVKWVGSDSSWFGVNNTIASVFNSSLAVFMVVFGLVLLLLITMAFRRTARR
jgi:hypothetical protein